MNEAGALEYGMRSGVSCFALCRSCLTYLGRGGRFLPLKGLSTKFIFPQHSLSE